MGLPPADAGIEGKTMNVTLLRTQTPHGFVFTVLQDGATVFQTLDDCFGKDRVRDWSRRNKIEVSGLDGAWKNGV